jgi:hypothetical protein
MAKQPATVVSKGGWRSHTRYLEMHTRERYEMVHITDEVERIVRESGVDDGLCFVSPMHITAAIYVNDHESGLIHDIGEWLESSRLHAPTIAITRRAKTMPTPISNRCCFTTKRPCPSPGAVSTWAPGNASFMPSSMASAPSASS